MQIENTKLADEDNMGLVKLMEIQRDAAMRAGINAVWEMYSDDPRRREIAKAQFMDHYWKELGKSEPIAGELALFLQDEIIRESGGEGFHSVQSGPNVEIDGYVYCDQLADAVLTHILKGI